MNWPVILLLFLILVLALWINSLYAREWFFFSKQYKLQKEIDKRADLMKEALMIFTVSKEIKNFDKKCVHCNAIGAHTSMMEVVFENYWLKFYFNWKKNFLQVEDLSEVEHGTQFSIKLPIKNNRFESNKLVAFLGIPGPKTRDKLEKLMDIALKEREYILANYSKEKLLSEVVFPFLVNKCDLNNQDDAIVMLSFLATIVEENNNGKEEQ